MVAVLAQSAVVLLAALPLHASELGETNVWTGATGANQPPMTVTETRAFMRALTQYVFYHHLKRDGSSPQRGMVYEYFDTRRAGKPGQWVQGEALDTMHDGAWFAVAMVNAYRVTGDPFYAGILSEWILPFYLKMLNESDRLFPATRNDSRPNAPRFDREHQIQPGEKGFVPYWWDDGASISLERTRDRNLRGPFPCTDEIPPEKNTNHVLKGYSHGSSNHMAQDLALMLQMAWLLFHQSKIPAEAALAREIAEAARHLHESRVRHHGVIPAVAAAAALVTGDEALMGRVRRYDTTAMRAPDNHFTRALYSFTPGRRASFPGFADDQQYLYYGALAKHRTLPQSLAFKLVYDAATEPMLFHYYCDEIAPIPGVNRFDLHPFAALNGKLEDYYSDRKGPFKQPRPAGSRFGPQNMVVCGWALQAMNAHGDLWEERPQEAAGDQPVFIHAYPPGQGSDLTPTFAQFKLSDVMLGIASTRKALRLRGTAARPVEVRLYNRPDSTGSVVRVSLAQDKIVAINGEGEELQAEVHQLTRIGGEIRFELSIPYGIVKGQRPWWTGVPHKRYSVRVNGSAQNLYFMSEEEQMKRWLTWELSGGLRTWEKVLKVKGHIPTSLGAGPAWDHFSDSGGYAHLISAAAQWILVLEGKRDWELQFISQPRMDTN